MGLEYIVLHIHSKAWAPCRVRCSKKVLNVSIFVLSSLLDHIDGVSVCSPRNGCLMPTFERPAYLSLDRWRPSDGYVRLQTFMQMENMAPAPVFLPRTNATISSLQNMRSNEHSVIETVSRMLRRCSIESVVIDSGSNEGMWSLLAAANGCRAVAIDPQPQCLELLRLAALQSNLSSRIDTINAVVDAPAYNVSDAPAGRRHHVSDSACHGTASFLPHGAVSDSTSTGRTWLARAPRNGSRTAVAAMSLDSLLQERLLPRDHVAFWHIDVEGAEVRVLQSATRLLRAGRIRRVLVEIIPNRWVAFGFNLSHGVAALAACLPRWPCVTMCPPRQSWLTWMRSEIAQRVAGHRSSPLQAYPRFQFTTSAVRSLLLPPSKGLASRCENVLCVHPTLAHELRPVGTSMGTSGGSF